MRVERRASSRLRPRGGGRARPPARAAGARAPPRGPPAGREPGFPTQAPRVHSPPQGAIQLDTKPANAMVESYAEAASSLADHISELKEQTQLESRRGEPYRAVADVAKKLFRAAPDETPGLLEGLGGSLAPPP